MFSTLLLTAQASYPNGTWTELPPVDAAGETWGGVLDRAAARMLPDSVLLLTADMAIRLGYGTDPDGQDEAVRAAAPALEDARARGWKCSRLDAWTVFHGPDRPAVHVGVLEWMSDLQAPADGLSAVETAALVEAWRQEFGTPWAGTPAVAGIALLRHLGRGPQRRSGDGFERPRWQLPLEDYQSAWSHAAPFRGITWTHRAPQLGEFEHTFDVNKQWLTAAGQTPVAWSRLVHTGRVPFDPKRAGMWLVEFEPWTCPDLPDPAGSRGEPGKARWVSTPRLGLVHGLCQRSDAYAHMGYKILDSWTGQGSLVLKPWADALRRVLGTDLDAAARGAYARTLTSISQLDVEGRPRRVFRPDWAASVVDMATANLWRKLLRVGTASGRWPIRISADSPTYASDAEHWEDDVPEGLEIAPGYGKLKWKSSAPARQGAAA